MKIYFVGADLDLDGVYGSAYFFRVVRETAHFVVLQEVERHIVKTNPSMAYAEVIPSLKDSPLRAFRTKVHGRGRVIRVRKSTFKRPLEGRLWDGGSIKVNYLKRTAPISVDPEDFFADVSTLGLSGHALALFTVKTFGDHGQIRWVKRRPQDAIKIAKSLYFHFMRGHRLVKDELNLLLDL
jgi:hypothetical protein